MKGDTVKRFLAAFISRFSQLGRITKELQSTAMSLRMIPIKPTTPRSFPVSSNARMAPTPAEGRVERIVMG